MALNPQQFQERQDAVLEELARLTDQLREVHEQEAALDLQRGEAVATFQQYLADVLAEDVFTQAFLEGHGFQRARGRQAVKARSEVVTQAAMPLGELVGYVQDRFGTLQQLQEQVEQVERESDRDTSHGDQLKARYAEVVYDAIDNAIFTRNQFKLLGFDVPARPKRAAVTESEPAAEHAEHDHDE